MLRPCVSLTAVVLAAVLAAPTHAQVTYTWATAANGNYNAAANWSPVAVPTVIDSVVINAVGSAYTVTLNDNRSITNFTLNSANATFAHTAGTYTLGGTMTLTSGVYNLNGGTIAGGSITGSAGRLRATNGTLNNVQIGAGVLDLSSGSLTLTGGSNFATGSTYTTGTSFGLTVNQAAAVNNLDLTLGNGAYVDTSAAGFTLGPTSVIRVTGTNSARVSAVNVSSGVGYSFTNQGLLENTGTGTLFIGNSSPGNAGTWSNAGGTIRLGAGSTVNLGGSFSSVNLGTFDRGGTGVPGVNGTLNVIGTMTMAGNLDLHTATGAVRLDGGRIIGNGFALSTSGSSRLRATPATITFATSLDNVQVGVGVLDLSEANGQIELGGGSNFAPGSAYTTSSGFRFRVSQTQAVNNLDLTLGNTAYTHLRGNFTLGASSAIRVTGTNSATVYAMYFDTATAGTFVNQGLLESTGTARLGIGRSISGGSAAGTWSNASGTIRLGPNAIVDLGANFSSGNLGTIDRGGIGVPGTNGTLNLIGALTLTGNLDLHTVTGTLIGANSGQILGGGFTLSSSGTSKYVATSANTRLDNVQLGVGVLDVTTSGGSLALLGGTNFAPGSTYTTGSSFALNVNQTTAIDNLDLTLGNGTTITAGINGFALGASSALRLTGSNGASVAVTTNNGVIRNTSSGTLNLNAATFTNAAGGLVDAQSGITSIISNPWSNAGTIRLGSGATVNLGGAFSSANLGTIDRGGTGVPGTNGTLNLTGIMTLAANMDLHTTTGTLTGFGGTVTGGGFTLSSSGTSRYVAGTSNSTLNNVLIAPNTLNLATTSGRLTLTSGSNFTAPVTLATGDSFLLTVNQAAAVNNLDLTLGNGASVSVGANGFTLGASSAVRLTAAGSGSITSSATFTNAGLVRNSSSGTLTVNPTTFTVTATGVVEGTNGTITVPDATNFTNVSSGTLTTGTYRTVNATMNWGTRQVSTLAANTTVEVRGSGGNIAAINPLQTNNGTFVVGDGKAFTVANAANSFTNTGTITVTGTGASLTVPSGINFTNYNAGTQTLTGGVFQVLNGGSLNLGARTTPVINAGTTVTLGGSTASFSVIEGGVLTTVSGTLGVNGGKVLTVAPSGLTVTNGGVLTGHLGTVAGNVVVQPGGRLSPGNSPGQITISGGLDLGGTVPIDISPVVGGGNNSNTVGNTTPGSGFDIIIVTPPPTAPTAPTNVTLRPSMNVQVVAADTSPASFAAGGFWATRQAWSILRTTNGVVLDSGGNPYPSGAAVATELVNRDSGQTVNYSAFGGFTFEVVVLGNAGAGQQQLDLVFTPVPEPTGMTVVTTAVMGGAIALRRRLTRRSELGTGTTA